MNISVLMGTYCFYVLHKRCIHHSYLHSFTEKHYTEKKSGKKPMFSIWETNALIFAVFWNDRIWMLSPLTGYGDILSPYGYRQFENIAYFIYKNSFKKNLFTFNPCILWQQLLLLFIKIERVYQWLLTNLINMTVCTRGIEWIWKIFPMYLWIFMCLCCYSTPIWFLMLSLTYLIFSLIVFPHIYLSKWCLAILKAKLVLFVTQWIK